MKKPKKKQEFITVADLFTFGNLLAGVTALLFTINHAFTQAAILILVAVLFDWLDGKIARLLKQETAIGEYLDSLADVISFGLVPAFFLMVLHPSLLHVLLGIIFILAGAYRLARFHYLKSQGMKGYQGMPITFNGIVIPLLYFTQAASAIASSWLILSALLMVSTIKIKKIL